MKQKLKFLYDSILKQLGISGDLEYNQKSSEDLMILLKKRMLILVASEDERAATWFEEISHLLALSFELSDNGKVDGTFPYSIIEELFGLLPIEFIEKLFDFLEMMLDRVTSEIDPGKGKGLILLRSCNDLCKRLSKVDILLIKTKNELTLGRIKIFLSIVFPICEKSGVNRKGDFNIENVTRLDEDVTDKDALEHGYVEIWSLQKYFSNPLLLLQKNHFDDLKSVNYSLKDLESGFTAESL
jgi:hypothetical protein